MSDVVPDGSGKFLKVKFIQRKDCAALESAYLMDEVRHQTRPSLSPKPRPYRATAPSSVSTPSAFTAP